MVYPQYFPGDVSHQRKCDEFCPQSYKHCIWTLFAKKSAVVTVAPNVCVMSSLSVFPLELLLCMLLSRHVALTSMFSVLLRLVHADDSWINFPGFRDEGGIHRKLHASEQREAICNDLQSASTRGDRHSQIQVSQQYFGGDHGASMPAALYGETPSSQSTPLWRTQLLYKLRIDLSPPVSSAQHSPQGFIVCPGTSSDGNTTVNRSRFRCAWSFVREAESWDMCIVCSACFEVSWTRELAPGKYLIATCCSWIVQHPPLFLRNVTCDTFPRSFVMPLQTATALHATSSSRVIRLSVLSMSLLTKKPRARGFASSLTTHHPSLGAKTKNLIVRASWDKSTLWIHLAEFNKLAVGPQEISYFGVHNHLVQSHNSQKSCK